ncbi:MAG: hypothetical protein ABGW99_06835 [Zunongwangia sp.]
MASENEYDFNIEEVQNSDDALAIINKYARVKTLLDMPFWISGYLLSGTD